MTSVLPVVMKATSKHTATMIFLHGLGDTGHGWAGILRQFLPSYMKIVCPNAPSIPITCNDGFVMPGWYDIKNLEDVNDTPSTDREDLEGVKKSTQLLETLVSMEVNELEEHGGYSRLMIGGFSQGGAVALSTLFSVKQDLAGCVALSTYLPGNVAPKFGQKLKTPIFHGHGENDEMIRLKRATFTSTILKEMVENYQFTAYPGMGHEAHQHELEHLREFVINNCPIIR